MEALRLLTRSTKFQKKINDGSAGLIPSAGAPSHPQLFGKSSQDDSRGLKRKRTEDAQLSEIDDIPDFFANRSNGQRNEARSSQAKPHRARQRPPESYKLLTEDECKKTLRSHKIKVGVLPQTIGTGDNVKQKKKSRRSKTKSSSREKVTPIYPPILRSFHELHHFGVSRRLMDNVLDQGFLMPTEVQLAALPMLLGKERNNVEPHLPGRDLIDLLTVAPTGSGKTLAFLIPIMDDVLLHRHMTHEPERAATSAIILAPTHELVNQIVNEGRRLAAGTGVRISALRKGQSIAQGLPEEDEDTSAAAYVKSDILVSTPALVGNSLSGSVDTQKELSQIRRLVLDEADVLLDPLFRDDTIRVWDACTNTSLRSSLWSATMGASIESLATDRMFQHSGRELTRSKADAKVVRIIAGLKDSAIPNVKHQLTYAASEQGKLLALRNLLHPSTASSSSIVLRPPFLVFTQTIARAIALHSELRYDISVEAGGAARIAVLHSDLSLSARSDIMASFRKGEIWVLITTDLLSRGVDFRGVNGVVNYDIPNSSASYVHRAGRTGRAGREGGVCVTLYTKEDIPYVKSVANVIAAAEKVKGDGSQNDDGGMPQWLLDALPDLSKEVRKELKEKGVAARRNVKGGKTDGSSNMRISTKSGYERKLENRRKASRRKQGVGDMSDDNDDEDDDGNADELRHKALQDSDDGEFGGFDD